MNIVEDSNLLDPSSLDAGKLQLFLPSSTAVPFTISSYLLVEDPLTLALLPSFRSHVPPDR